MHLQSVMSAEAGLYMYAKCFFFTVSVVMKPAPASEISAQQENPSISILAVSSC